MLFNMMIGCVHFECVSTFTSSYIIIGSRRNETIEWKPWYEPRPSEIEVYNTDIHFVEMYS